MTRMRGYNPCEPCLEAGYRTAIGEGVPFGPQHGLSEDCESTFVWAAIAYHELLRNRGDRPSLSEVSHRVHASS